LAPISFDHVSQWSASANVLHVGSWADVSRDGFTAGLVGKPNMTVNLAANYAYNDQVTLFGRIDNLFNVQYENPIGFDRPGFGIYGGIRISNR
jgi:vitamin B12 transporter